MSYILGYLLERWNRIDVGKGVLQSESLYTAVITIMENSMGIPPQSKDRATMWSNSLPFKVHIQRKSWSGRSIYTFMLSAFTVTKIWKQTAHWHMNESGKHGIYTMKCC